MKLSTTYIDNINKELSDIDNYLDIKITKYQNVSQPELIKFSNETGTIVTNKLNKIRTKIINWLKPTLKAITDKITPYQEIVDLATILLGLSITDVPSLLTAVPKIITLVCKMILLQFTAPLAEALELQADIAEKVVILSDNIQEIANKDFNIPNMPPPIITVDSITLGDLA